MVNRFQKIDQLSNRRLWIAKAVKGSLFAWRPSFQKDSTSTARVSRRKRRVGARWCRSATLCTRVRMGNFFVIVIGSYAGTKKQITKIGIAKSQCAEFLKCAGAKNKNVASKSRVRLRFDTPPCSPAPSATKLQSSCFTFRGFPMHRHRDAQLGLLHLNSAPNEATTSIWLKAMMVCRDLRGNNEPSENGIRHGGGDWEPEGL
jgi:hypothetical protein